MRYTLTRLKHIIPVDGPHAQNSLVSQSPARRRSTDHCIKAAFHDTDIFAMILADTSETGDFPKLFLWQAERGSRPTRRHPRDDHREDAGVCVDVGVVECGLNGVLLHVLPLCIRRT